MYIYIYVSTYSYIYIYICNKVYVYDYMNMHICKRGFAGWQIGRLAPSCTSVIFAKANHWLYLEEPAKFNNLVLQANPSRVLGNFS